MWLASSERRPGKALIPFVFFFAYKKTSFLKSVLLQKLVFTSNPAHFCRFLFSVSLSLSNLDDITPAQALYLFPNIPNSLICSLKMPSTFLSLLFAALTLERATAAPTQSNLSLVSRDQGNSTLPQWAIDACKNAPGCEVKNGIPSFQKPSTGPVNYAAIPTNSTSIQSGLDGEKDDYYIVQLDDQLVGTGLCAPDEFLKILFERSECPIGSTLPGCGASKS